MEEDFVGEEYEVQKAKDRVAFAFSKFDLDGDGFLSWDEFTQVVSCIGLGIQFQSMSFILF